jgi:hypothetical protein
MNNMNTRNYYYEFASECESLIKLMRKTQNFTYFGVIELSKDVECLISRAGADYVRAGKVSCFNGRLEFKHDGDKQEQLLEGIEAIKVVKKTLHK